MEPLIVALRADYPTVGYTAAGALYMLGEPAVGPLIVALKAEESQVRHLAAKALLRRGDERAVEPLIALLKDEDWHIRGMAIKALEWIGDTRAIPELERVEKEDKDERVRNHATACLSHIVAWSLVNSETQLARAESLAKKGLEIYPMDAILLDTLGWAFYKQGKYAEAVATLEQAATSERTLARAHYHLGLGYLKTNQKENALKALETAFTLDRWTFRKYREMAKTEKALDAIRETPEFQLLITPE